MTQPLEFGQPAPAGWQRQRLKDVAFYVDRGVAPEYAEGDTGIVAFNQKCVRPDLSIEPELGRPVASGSVLPNSPARLRAGDIVINSTGRGTLGRAGLVRNEPAAALVADGHVTVVRFRRGDVDPRFVSCILATKAFYQQANVCLAVGATNQTELNREALRRMAIALPPLDEQRRIAAYLDAETARIDELIGEQEIQLRLITEHRHTLLSGAVGARLGGEASSLEGALEPLPEGWRLVPLRTVATIQSGLTLGKTYDGPLQERPYLRVANVQDGGMNLDEITTIDVPPDVAARCELRVGDVLMTEGGDNDKLGRGTVWGGEIPNCLHQNHVFAVRPDPAVLRPEYLAALTASAWGRAYFMATAHQTTNLAATNRAKLGRFPLPLPPLARQNRTLSEVGEQLARLDTIQTEARQQINLLRERRQALITTAVTRGLNGLPGVA